MDNTPVTIEWKYTGTPDGFFGTGATASERTLVWILAIGSSLLLGFFWLKTSAWTWWQIIIASLLTLDILGGVIANSLNSCKRYYHSPIQPEETGFTALSKNHFVFTALHVHPLLVGLLFGNMNWAYGAFWYPAVLVTSIIVLRTPLYLQRPLAMGMVMLAILVNYYIISPVNGFEWLIPALFLKIVYGHNVREEPYRP